MAYIAFDRADQTGWRSRSGAQDIGQGRHLDRVPQFRPRPVRLDVTQAVGGHPGSPQQPAQQGFLGEAVGRGHAVGPSILVDSRRLDDCEHPVTIACGIAQALEYDHSTTIAAHDAIGALIEWFAATVGSHQPHARSRHAEVRTQDQVHSSCDSLIAFIAAQALAGLVHRDQRRRAGSVDRQTWPLQIEQIGQTPRQHTVGHPRATESVDPIDIAEQAARVAIVVVDHADVDTGLASSQAFTGLPGMHQGFPGDFQKHPLLSVHVRRLGVADAKEASVETTFIDYPGPARAELALNHRVGIVKPGAAPACGRHLLDGIALLRHQRPERLQRVGPRQAARRTDDGYGFFTALQRGLQLAHTHQCLL
ncbi:hypothetical protein D3C77_172930 [compost metagenome]